MAQKGIHREAVVCAAVALVEERGRPSLNMRELAERLGIKTPSLYNHIESMDGLLQEVCRRAVDEFEAAQLRAMEGKRGDAAVRALADGYRAFARERYGLYQAIMSIPSEEDEDLTKIAAAVAEPAMQSLGDYPLTRERRMHWQRVLRSMLHGFVSQERAGYFSHFPVPADESFRLTVQCFLDGLRAEIGGENHGEG